MQLLTNEQIETIIKTKTYKELSELTGASIHSTKKWKTGERDWRLAQSRYILNLMRNIKGPNSI